MFSSDSVEVVLMANKRSISGIKILSVREEKRGIILKLSKCDVRSLFGKMLKKLTVALYGYAKGVV